MYCQTEKENFDRVSSSHLKYHNHNSYWLGDSTPPHSDELLLQRNKRKFYHTRFTIYDSWVIFKINYAFISNNTFSSSTIRDDPKFLHFSVHVLKKSLRYWRICVKSERNLLWNFILLYITIWITSTADKLLLT